MKADDLQNDEFLTSFGDLMDRADRAVAALEKGITVYQRSQERAVRSLMKLFCSVLLPGNFF